jgi:tetratricopeptide (TPR) repeat protein
MDRYPHSDSKPSTPRTPHRRSFEPLSKGEPSTSSDSPSSSSEGQEKVNQYRELGRQFYANGHYDNSLTEFRKVIEIKERRLEKGHHFIAPDLHNIGAVYFEQGKLEPAVDKQKDKFQKAEEHFRKALAGHMKKVDSSKSKYSDIATILYCLDDLYKRRGEDTDVKMVFRETFARYHKSNPDSKIIDSKIVEPLEKLGIVYHDELGKFEHAEQFLLEALKVRNRSRDQEGQRGYITNTWYKLGVLYREWGKDGDAERIFSKLHAIRKDNLPAVILHELAIVHLKKEELGKAEEFAKKALHRSFGGDCNTAETLHLLGHIDLKLSKYEDAERYARRAVDIEKKKSQFDDLAIANSYLQLGIACDKLGKGEEAKKCFEDMFSFRRDVLELGYPENKSHVDSLIKFYENRNDNEKTELLLTEALALSEKKLGLESRAARDYLNRLVTFYDKQGQPERVKLLWDEAVVRQEDKLGFDNEEARGYLKDGAKFLLDRDKPELAKELWEKAVVRRETENEELGFDNEEARGYLKDGAKFLLDRDKPELAKELWEKAVVRREDKLGFIDREARRCLEDGAKFLLKHKKPELAKELWEKAVVRREDKLGFTHLETIRCLEDGANFLLGLKKYELVEKLWEKAVVRRESHREFGLDHAETIRCLDWQARFYEQWTDFNKALEFYRKVLDRWETNYCQEAEHALDNLINFLKKRGQLKKAAEELESAYHRRKDTPTRWEHAGTTRCLKKLKQLKKDIKRSQDSKRMGWKGCFPFLGRRRAN